MLDPATHAHPTVEEMKAPGLGDRFEHAA